MCKNVALTILFEGEFFPNCEGYFRLNLNQLDLYFGDHSSSEIFLINH